ncbi:MAG: hypothetical protein DWG79_01180 [Chloroflexi bacterium]|nr:ion channel [Chloroflexota bacterium]MDA1147301.1 ion channel [Chloroflexota bacterium]MQC82470.1 hypothetical protein [Chloroflexota bacterium]
MTSVSRAKRDGAALDAFTRATELPLLLLALAMVPLIAVPLAFDLAPSVDRAIVAADWMIWAVFGLELGVRTYLAPARLPYLIRHWYDVVIVLVPFLRPFRVIRSARALRLLRAGRLIAFFGRIRGTASVVLTRHRLDYALASAIAAVFVAAALVARLEQDAEGSIDGFGSALWWALVTVTTVGYGDYAPSTPAGRGVAVVLMLLGIGLFGLIAANIAAFFVTEHEDDQTALLIEEIRGLRLQVEELQQTVRPAQASTPDPGP